MLPRRILSSWRKLKRHSNWFWTSFGSATQSHRLPETQKNFQCPPGHIGRYFQRGIVLSTTIPHSGKGLLELGILGGNGAIAE
jgi:hypothetical protein